MVVLVPAEAAIERVDVDFDYVRRLAAECAQKPYRSPSGELPKTLAALSRTEEMNIRFRPARAIWGGEGLPFSLQLVHRGPLRLAAMSVREFSSTHEQLIPFSKDYFEYGDVTRLGWLSSSLNYAGVRVEAAINRPDSLEHWVTFMAGALRSIGAGQEAGAWARGLAVNAGVAGLTEEAPAFTAVWLGKPDRETRRLTVYALLDAPSVAAAYHFVISPGATTMAEVRAELYFRQSVKVVGFAPLVSSFWYGENTPRPAGVLWPERHDSDGLLVEGKGQAPLWRPLGNPRGVQRSELAVSQLVRFGLMQRDRNPAHYQDLDTRYQAKPSVWVEPIGDWGTGAVRLLEMPDLQGTDHNVVAFWVPSRRINRQQPVPLAYRIYWGERVVADHNLAKVVATRSGALPGMGARRRLFWVDFEGEVVAGLSAAEVTAKVDVRNGRVLADRVMRNPALPGWRVEIEVEADDEASLVELSCQLRRGYDVLSENWNSPWTP